MDLPPELLLLLPLAVAAGLDLHLTLLVLFTGTAMIEGVSILDLPHTVGIPLLFVLAGLYLAELAAELRPFPALAWHTLQLVLRPLGAGLLGVYLLREEAFPYPAVGIIGAMAVAAFCHVLSWGYRLVSFLGNRPSRINVGLTIAADLLALGFLALAHFHPGAAAPAAGLFLALGLAFGGSLHGAARFGVALLTDRVWGIVSPTEWWGEEELPRWIRTRVAEGVPGSTRGAPCATIGVAGPGRFKAGWILQRNKGLLFGFRKRWGSGIRPLDGDRLGEEIGTLARTIRYRSSDGTPWALFLQVGLNAPESHKW